MGLKEDRSVVEMILRDGDCFGVSCRYCPLDRGGEFDCDGCESAIEYAHKYINSFNKDDEGDACNELPSKPAKHEFERDVSYELNGETYIPEVEQEQIDSLIAKRAVDLVALNKKRNALKAFKRKYKEA